ncbi:MAG: L-lysine 2,3-aminomutase [Chlamydiales bacterium]|nr:L-lysine 2,3-aminomutase [Chlamydiales bacterium]MCH9619329.1 L-lysine 2,3-aminomutase [Chlamydiales bacterium]MCH9622133.1 L-lysine 2,3-aminomutase [Chlamydiales bacterium]
MRAITSLEQLCSYLELTDTQCQKLIAHPFPLLLPLRLAKKIQKGTLNDPILRQFVPLQEENSEKEGFTSNPVGDIQACQTPKFLKKYQSRALLMTSSACAMNCRFCFRREFPYESGPFEQELQLIREDTTLREIILSGGDPLSLPNRLLKNLLSQLEEIPHLKRVRYHTRYPIAYPERIDETFLSFFQSRLQFWFAIHCNHPKELDDDVILALQKIPAPVLCQTVLLKGVNDHLPTLKELCEKLIDNGFFPYYLHQLDKVSGAAHFEVSEKKGQELIKGLEEELSGYGVFRYVKEVAGAPCKVSVH